MDASGRECSPPPAASAPSIARMVLYHDIFHHPLRVDEIEQLCGQDPGPGIRELAARGLVETDGRLVWRRGKRADCTRREERTRAAERLWPRAQRASRALASLPFVRGVLITGSMSKRSAAKDGDIDFLLLVEPGRVWTTKAAIQTVRRALPDWARAMSCANYLLSTESLEVTPRSVYTAVELATAVPMAGPAPCTALLDANGWATAYVPGLAWSRRRAELAPVIATPPWAAAVERAAPPALEATAQRWVTGFWERRYHWLPAAERERRFRRGAGVATNHLHDWSQWVLDEFSARLAAESVTAP